MDPAQTETRRNRLSSVSSRIALPLAAAIAVFALALGSFLALRHGSSERVRAMAEGAATRAAAGIARAVDAAVHEADPLTAAFARDRAMTRMEAGAYAADILSSGPWFTGVSVAPGAKVQFHFPEQGNEAMIGHDLLSNPDRMAAVLQAIETRAPVVAGPSESSAGGRSLFIRIPVSDPADERKDIVSLSLDFDLFVKSLDLEAAYPELRFALAGTPAVTAGAGKDANTPGTASKQRAAETVFWGQQGILRQSPVRAPVRIPGGQWTLAAMPAQGWNGGDFYAFLLLLVGGGAAVLAFFAVARSMDHEGDHGFLSFSGEAARARERTFLRLADDAVRELRMLLTRAEGSIESMEADSIPGLRAARHPDSGFRLSIRGLSRFTEETALFVDLSAGRVALERNEFDLAALVDEVAERIRPVAAAKGLDFHCTVDSTVPQGVRGDAGRLAWALDAILRESIAFTDSGEVSLSVLNEETRKNGVGIRFTVRDTGAVLKREYVESMCDPFASPRGPITARRGTCGLAMACASGLLTLMEGTSVVDYGLESGVAIMWVVSFALPREAKAATRVPEPAEASAGTAHEADAPLQSETGAVAGAAAWPDYRGVLAPTKGMEAFTGSMAGSARVPTSPDETWPGQAAGDERESVSDLPVLHGVEDAPVPPVVGAMPLAAATQTAGAEPPAVVAPLAVPLAGAAMPAGAEPHGDLMPPSGAIPHAGFAPPAGSVDFIHNLQQGRPLQFKGPIVPGNLFMPDEDTEGEEPVGRDSVPEFPDIAESGIVTEAPAPEPPESTEPFAQQEEASRISPQSEKGPVSQQAFESPAAKAATPGPAGEPELFRPGAVGADEGPEPSRPGADSFIEITLPNDMSAVAAQPSAGTPEVAGTPDAPESGAGAGIAARMAREAQEEIFDLTESFLASGQGKADAAPPPAEAGHPEVAEAEVPIPSAETGGAALRIPPAILLVDDGMVNREIVTRMLASKGYACDLAEDGPTAVEKCRLIKYDLVLMDCYMPGQDGYETTRLVRALAGPGNPVIVGMSARVMDDGGKRCRDAGMDGMIPKPFTTDELMVLVRKVEAAGEPA